MASYTSKLSEMNLIQPPKWLKNNVMFEGMTGSTAYGTSNDTSDMDVIGMAIPPKEIIFPHLRGEILGFGTPGERFEQFQIHHVKVPEWNKEFDITIFGIVKFFHLIMENNPNAIELLYLPRRCVLHSTPMYEKIRDNRSLFLHKGSFHKHRGYIASQMSKVRNKSNASNPKRAGLIEKFGFDTKFAAHAIRLSLQLEEIMSEGTLTLDRNAKMLSAVRNGEWTLDKINSWIDEKEVAMESLYTTSTLQHSPNETAIHDLLLECIEDHYGKVSSVLVKDVKLDSMVSELQNVIEKYK